MESNTPRWTTIAGFVFVVAWMIGLLIVPNSPGPTASYAQLKAFYLAHQQAQMIQSYLIDGVAGIALLIFAVALRVFFRDHDGPGASGEHRALAGVVFGAGAPPALSAPRHAESGEWNLVRWHPCHIAAEWLPLASNEPS